MFETVQAVCVCKYVKVCAYVRKSLTSSTVSSPVESRVRSAQLRGESSGVSRMGEDRALGGSSVCPVEMTPAESAHFYICMMQSWVLGWRNASNKFFISV